MRVVACAQRSPAWHAARLGKLTGSRAAAALARATHGESAGRRNTRQELVLERITGRSHERTFSTAHMARGVQFEAAACAAYEAETGTLVDHVGLLVHDELAAGYSPDGLVLTGEGLLEVKCPAPHTHFDNVVTGAKMPAAYRTQIMHGLWLSGAAWCDLVSYHPEFGPSLRVKIERVYARDVDLVAYDRDVRIFLAEVDRAFAAVPRGSLARAAGDEHQGVRRLALGQGRNAVGGLRGLPGGQM